MTKKVFLVGVCYDSLVKFGLSKFDMFCAQLAVARIIEQIVYTYTSLQHAIWHKEPLKNF